MDDLTRRLLNTRFSLARNCFKMKDWAGTAAHCAVVLECVLRHLPVFLDALATTDRQRKLLDEARRVLSGCGDGIAAAEIEDEPAKALGPLIGAYRARKNLLNDIAESFGLELNFGLVSLDALNEIRIRAVHDTRVAVKEQEAKVYLDFVSNLLSQLRIDAQDRSLDGSAQELPDGEEGMRQAIREGRLTPYIGPLCHVLRDYRSALADIAGRVSGLFSVLEEETDRRYVRSIVAAKSLGLESVSDAGEVNPSGIPQPFLTFQERVARAGAQACRVFGNRMTDDCLGVTDARRHSVIFQASSEDGKLLRDILFDACEACEDVAREMRDECSQESAEGRCFRPKQIAQRLALLTYIIFRGDNSAWADNKGRDWDARHTFACDNVKDVGDGVARGARLSIGHLEWLGELLWYTLRHDTSIIPTADELAFQLSFCVSNSRPAKVRVGTVAIALETEAERRPAECVRTILEQANSYCKPEHVDDAEDFYTSIARLLRRHRKLRSGTASVDSAGKAVQTVGQLVSMAVSTNLGMEIENALRELRQSHSALFPVTLVGRNGEIAWILHSLQNVDNDWIRRWALVPEKDCTAQHLKEWLGTDCLVIKLLGSPLDELPGLKDEVEVLGTGEKRNLECEHSVLLSDRELFRELFEDLLGQGACPECIKGLLQDARRMICFLGHDIGDVHGAFSIAKHGKLVGGENRRTFVDESPEDPFREAQFRELELKRVASKLRQFTRIVNEVLCK